MLHKSPPPRVYRVRTDADTWTLVKDVTDAAIMASRHTPRFPIRCTRAEAMEYVHALAASVRYRADADTQRIKMPHVLLGTGVGDCKSTAILCASLLSSAGCNVQLKFLQYTADRPWWEHVYCVADGVAVDPLLPLGDEYAYLRAITTRIT